MLISKVKQIPLFQIDIKYLQMFLVLSKILLFGKLLWELAKKNPEVMVLLATHHKLPALMRIQNLKIF